MSDNPDDNNSECLSADETVYATDDILHQADLSTPLDHGIVRYVPSIDLPSHVRNSLPAKNDRPFIFVPMGYIRRNLGGQGHGQDFMRKVLNALGLELPNIIVVTSDTVGSADEQMNSFHVQKQRKIISKHADDIGEEQMKEVLAAKVGRLLEAVIESSAEVGAWILPDCPRRRNGAVEMISSCYNTGTKMNVSLGLIGLGEDEEDLELKESLYASKVPLGSPAKSVSKLVYDTRLKDGAPSPSLTHLIVFESPEEKQIFRQELLDLVPDFMVSYGNITRDSMNNVFDNAKSGSPVILLKHTGKNIDSLCRMFRHVNKYVQQKEIDDNHQSIENNLGDSCFIPPLPPSIRQEENANEDLVRLFINTWPSGYNPESIVLADPLTMSGPILQKRILSAITSAFDLKTGSTDTRLAKRKVLQYAWSLHDICKKHSRSKKFSAESLHLQMVFFTLTSIVASIFYERIYGDKPESRSESNIQLTIYMCTILLPLYITSLKQESNERVALTNWVAFRVTAAKIESEIFKFRCQVGPYRIEEKTEIALLKPITQFSSTIKVLFSSVKSHLVEDGMPIPSNFWAFDPKEHLQSLSSSSLIQKANASSESQTFPNKDTKNCETTPILGPTCFSPYGTTKDNFDEEKLMYSSSEQPFSNNNDDNISIISTESSNAHSTQGSVKFTDDNFCPIKTDDYIEYRMKELMHKKADQIKAMANRNAAMNNIIKFITICSGATAALSLQWAVPIVLAVTAALSTGQEFRKYPRRIDLGNVMVVQLNELKLWWMGLSMYQKQLPHNKDHLILSSEKIVLQELESSFDSPVVHE